MWMARSMTSPSTWWNMGVWVASLSERYTRPGRDHVERRALRLHRADLHRRGVGAQDLRLLLALMPFEVESVLHRPRRMEFRHVERGEIMPLVLDLRPFGDGETQVGEDFGQFVHHLADWMDGTLRLFRRGKRQVDRLGRELPVELGVLERRLAVGDRGRDLFAESMDFRRLSGPRVRIHRAERLQAGSDAAGLAEHRDAQLIERTEVGRAADLIEKVSV